MEALRARDTKLAPSPPPVGLATGAACAGGIAPVERWPVSASARACVCGGCRAYFLRFFSFFGATRVALLEGALFCDGISFASTGPPPPGLVVDQGMRGVLKEYAAGTMVSPRSLGITEVSQ
jgi:hypothetical protein